MMKRNERGNLKNGMRKWNERGNLKKETEYRKWNERGNLWAVARSFQMENVPFGGYGVTVLVAVQAVNPVGVARAPAGVIVLPREEADFALRWKPPSRGLHPL
jgi:hypothetical protein